MHCASLSLGVCRPGLARAQRKDASYMAGGGWRPEVLATQQAASFRLCSAVRGQRVSLITHQCKQGRVITGHPCRCVHVITRPSRPAIRSTYNLSRCVQACIHYGAYSPNISTGHMGSTNLPKWVAERGQRAKCALHRCDFLRAYCCLLLYVTAARESKRAQLHDREPAAWTPNKRKLSLRHLSAVCGSAPGGGEKADVPIFLSHSQSLPCVVRETQSMTMLMTWV
jgi:hypothetical protein